MSTSAATPTYDEAEANRRLRAALAVIDAARAALDADREDGVRCVHCLPERHARWIAIARALAAYDAATATAEPVFALAPHPVVTIAEQMRRMGALDGTRKKRDNPDATATAAPQGVSNAASLDRAGTGADRPRG